jgi:hypothetical protein
VVGRLIYGVVEKGMGKGELADPARYKSPPPLSSKYGRSTAPGDNNKQKKKTSQQVGSAGPPHRGRRPPIRMTSLRAGPRLTLSLSRGAKVLDSWIPDTLPGRRRSPPSAPFQMRRGAREAEKEAHDVFLVVEPWLGQKETVGLPLQEGGACGFVGCLPGGASGSDRKRGGCAAGCVLCV